MRFVREEYLEEMAKIGYFSEKKGDSQHQTGFKVFVTNDSRPLAHIHISNETKQKAVCVQFSNPAQYFSYKGYPDKFTNQEAKDFDTFLRTDYKYAQVFSMGNIKFNVKTYWEYCVYQWKLENDEMLDNLMLNIDENGFVIFPEQPNYAEINKK